MKLTTTNLLLLLTFVLTGAGCSAIDRKLLLQDTGQYVGVAPRDVDPLVDSDGDGDPANDVDNSGEILGGLVAYLLRNPTPVGIGVAGSGLVVYLATRYFRRRRAEGKRVEEPTDGEETDEDES